MYVHAVIGLGMALLKFRNVVGRELEIEGEEGTVLDLIAKYFTPNSVSSASEQNVDNISTTLANVAYKVNPKVEAEWLVVYAYLLNKPQFSRAELLDSYRTSQRYSQNRRKNLSFNLGICVKNGWFNPISSIQFTLSPEGKLKAGEMLKF